MLSPLSRGRSGGANGVILYVKMVPVVYLIAENTACPPPHRRPTDIVGRLSWCSVLKPVRECSQHAVAWVTRVGEARVAMKQEAGDVVRGIVLLQWKYEKRKENPIFSRCLDGILKAVYDTCRPLLL